MDYLSDADSPVELEYDSTDEDSAPTFPSDAVARGNRITGYRYPGNERHFPADCEDYIAPSYSQIEQGSIPKKKQPKE
jgi:hypothetical protein